MFIAQMTEPPPDPNLWLNIIVPLIPWLLIFGFIWIFVFRKLRADQSKVSPGFEQRAAHYAAVEAKLDRVIQLLEERNGRGG